MTAVFVFAALIVVNAVYCIYDGRSEEAARQMDDFYRVEFKRITAQRGRRPDPELVLIFKIGNGKRMASVVRFFVVFSSACGYIFTNKVDKTTMK